MAQRLPGGYVVDPADPRSPSEAEWAAMSPAERKRVLAMLDEALEAAAVAEAEERAREAEERTAALEQRIRELEAENERLRGGRG